MTPHRLPTLGLGSPLRCVKRSEVRCAVGRSEAAINARLQSKNVGVLLQGPGYNAREFWAVPRVFVSSNSWFVDALVTPSASRWADWYAAAGFERVRRNPVDSPERENQFIRGFGSEVGMKFRVAVPGKLRWARVFFSQPLPSGALIGGRGAVEGGGVVILEVYRSPGDRHRRFFSGVAIPGA